MDAQKPAHFPTLFSFQGSSHHMLSVCARDLFLQEVRGPLQSTTHHRIEEAKVQKNHVTTNVFLIAQVP